ncbi:Bacterial regulatory protein, luxR family [compost metagenome]|jgi:DNA-binding CsgD family transcriptional regulator
MAEGLSPRQDQCLRMSASRTDKEIARDLGLSPHTVSLHIREAMRKLEAPSRRVALRRLTENPLGASSAMSAAAVISADDPVNVDRTQAEYGEGREDDGEWRSFRAMALSPGRLPAPPRWAGSRLGIILLTSLIVLMLGAAILGLLSVVVEATNRWAVDPNVR